MYLEVIEGLATGMGRDFFGHPSRFGRFAQHAVGIQAVKQRRTLNLVQIGPKNSGQSVAQWNQVEADIGFRQPLEFANQQAASVKGFHQNQLGTIQLANIAAAS